MLLSLIGQFCVVDLSLNCWSSLVIDLPRGEIISYCKTPILHVTFDIVKGFRAKTTDVYSSNGWVPSPSMLYCPGLPEARPLQRIWTLIVAKFSLRVKTCRRRHQTCGAPRCPFWSLLFCCNGFALLGAKSAVFQATGRYYTTESVDVKGFPNVDSSQFRAGTYLPAPRLSL